MIKKQKEGKEREGGKKRKKENIKRSKKAKERKIKGRGGYNILIGKSFM